MGTLNGSPGATAGTDSDIATVRDWVARSGLTNTAIAEAAGVDEKTVRLTQDRDWNPKVETLRSLMRSVAKGWRAGDPIPGALRHGGRQVLSSAPGQGPRTAPTRAVPARRAS